MLAGSGAAGQTCYRVIDITSYQSSDDRVLAINNAGEISGSKVVSGTDEHAFVWLPQVNPSYPSLAKDFNDIHQLSGLSGDSSNAADINETGQVAGSFVNVGRSTPEAMVWDLTASDLAATPLGFLAGTYRSMAWGINSASPYQVVGVSSDGGICPVDGTELFQGFVWNSTTQIMTQLGTTVDDGAAFAISTPTGAQAASIAGRVSVCGIVPACPALSSRGVRWQKDNPGMALELDAPTEFPDREAEARGVNAADQFVGWATEEPDEFDCLSRAVFWEPPNFDPVNLHADVVPPIHPDDDSIAFGLNDLALPQIVGSNLSTSHALLWQRTPTTWTVMDLNDQIGHCALEFDQGPTWTLRRGHAVNDSGWIVGWGNHSGNGVRAFLLVPLATCPGITCLSDINADGVVGINDFLDLLAAWGGCPDGPGELSTLCRADLNCDGIVGINDFARLLADWGTCVAPGSGPPQTIQECINRFGTEHLDLLNKCICLVEPEECPDE